MTAKPRTAAGYDRTFVGHVRATCLYVATKLGDLLDEVVIVGGLVPSLLVDQRAAGDQHVGTADLDVGLALAIFDDKRYQALTERLRSAGFAPDRNERGNPTRQRWQIERPPKVTVDFLIPPAAGEEADARVKDIEADFAAIIAPGLRLAFRDQTKVVIEGRTLLDEEARREVWVCGPAAFVAMKALAFRGRGENKDAYDLTYMLRNHPLGIKSTAEQLGQLLDDAEATNAVAFLDEDFKTVDSLGPRRVAQFLDEGNEAIQADAWGAVRGLLESLARLNAAS